MRSGQGGKSQDETAEAVNDYDCTDEGETWMQTRQSKDKKSRTKLATQIT